MSLSDEAFAGAGSAAAGVAAAAGDGRALQRLLDELGRLDGRALQRLLDELGRLPGIGPKSAQRIAYYLLEADAETARRLADAILRVKEQVHFCPICFNYATREHCDVCDDPTRRATAVASAWCPSRATCRPSSAPGRSTGCTTCWAG